MYVKRISPQTHRSKYGNRKTVIDGITFDSKAEAKYYCELKLRQMADEIECFDLQPKFLLQDKFKHNGKTERAIYYIADFWILYPDGREEVVDVKGHKTDVYKLKRKLFLKQYPKVVFLEV